MCFRKHCDASHRIEQSSSKAIIIQRHESEMDIASFQSARHRDRSFFDQLNLHARIALSIAAEEM
jgi:hypothetical protein